MGVWKLPSAAVILTGGGNEASAAPLGGPAIYDRSGGLAGLVQKLTFRDGRAVAAAKRLPKLYRRLDDLSERHAPCRTDRSC